ARPGPLAAHLAVVRGEYLCRPAATGQLAEYDHRRHDGQPQLPAAAADSVGGADQPERAGSGADLCPGKQMGQLAATGHQPGCDGDRVDDQGRLRSTVATDVAESPWSGSDSPQPEQRGNECLGQLPAARRLEAGGGLDLPGERGIPAAAGADVAEPD